MDTLQVVVEMKGARDDLFAVIETGTVLDVLELVVRGELKATHSATVIDDKGEIVRESE